MAEDSTDQPNTDSPGGIPLPDPQDTIQLPQFPDNDFVKGGYEPPPNIYPTSDRDRE